TLDITVWVLAHTGLVHADLVVVLCDRLEAVRAVERGACALRLVEDVPDTENELRRAPTTAQRLKRSDQLPADPARPLVHDHQIWIEAQDGSLDNRGPRVADLVGTGGEEARLIAGRLRAGDARDVDVIDPLRTPEGGAHGRAGEAEARRIRIRSA